MEIAETVIWEMEPLIKATGEDQELPECAPEAVIQELLAPDRETRIQIPLRQNHNF